MERLTANEKRIIETLRETMRESRGRPFQLVINHPGGNVPYQLMRAVPVRIKAVDKTVTDD